MENTICQRCAMPLSAPSDFGTNADGSPNTDYCVYCMKAGKFTSHPTMDERSNCASPCALKTQLTPTPGRRGRPCARSSPRSSGGEKLNRRSQGPAQATDLRQ
jgi:hypothetical protein